jgi:large subunit ribosomal protein L13
MKTYTARPSDIEKKWFIIDANNLVLGRMASVVAKMLRGKHKPTFTPHMDCGDNIIIINADKIHLTGNKANPKDGKFYYHHTNHPGGIKEVTAGKLLSGRFPERVVKKAIERMISRNPLGRQQMSNLYVYKGAEHPHNGQQPASLNVAEMNKKNIKG